MTACVVGVDGGGTKTVCVVATAAGEPLGRATGGPSNYQTIGAAQTRAVLDEVICAAALAAASAAGQPVRIDALCLAMAGVDRPDDLRAIQEIVAQLTAAGGDGDRFSWAVHDSRITIVNDAVASLVGGTGRKRGVVTVAGTGSIAFGMNAAGERRRAGGWGNVLGDEGSGYAVGLAGLRAVCRASDGRAPETALTQRVLAECGLTSPSDLIGRAYGQWGVAEIASIARLVFRAAEEGDPAARAIVEDAAAELALAAGAVIRALRMQDDAFEVVTAGGTWPGSALLRERFVAALANIAPGASVVAPRAEPVMGAVLLAREALGVVSLD